MNLENVGNLPQHQQRNAFVKLSDKDDKESQWIPQPAPRLHLPQDFAKLRDSESFIAKEKSKI